MISPGESAVAVLTLAPFLGREPRRVLVGDREAMASIEKTIRSRIRDFLDNDFERARWFSRGVDYVSVLESLGESSDPSHAEQVMLDFGDDMDLATDYLVRCNAAVDHLRSIANPKERTNMVGQQLVRPGDFEAAEFLRAHAIVNAPLLLLESMCMGTLTSIEVMACKTVYPTLYKAVCDSLYAVCIEKVAAKMSWTPGYLRDNVIGILLGIDLMSPELHGLIEKALATGQGKKGDEKQTAPSSPKLQTTSVSPPSERILASLRGT